MGYIIKKRMNKKGELRDSNVIVDMNDIKGMDDEKGGWRFRRYGEKIYEW